MKNIVLIGMMGCGKTTCAKLLAARLDLEAVDTDALIEAREGRSIPELFAAEGEAYFRDLERRVSGELAGRDGLVVACGGGLPLRADCIGPLRAGGTVFFLNRDPGEIYDSVPMDARPLGQGGRDAFLARFARREGVYRACADHIITQFATPQATVEAILECIGPAAFKNHL